MMALMSLLAAALVQASSPPESPPQPAATVVAPTAASAKIVMFRGPSVWGAGLACPIRYKGRTIVELARGKYAEWEVPPGRYVLTNKTSSLQVAVDAGEKAYVRCMVKPGFMVGRADLQIVDEETFAIHGAEYERKLVTVPEGFPATSTARQ